MNRNNDNFVVVLGHPEVKVNEKFEKLEMKVSSAPYIIAEQTLQVRIQI